MWKKLCDRSTFSELEIAKFDEHLLRQMTRNIGKAIHLYSVKCEGLVVNYEVPKCCSFFRLRLMLLHTKSKVVHCQDNNFATLRSPTECLSLWIQSLRH
jgi:hypothetical protein